MTIIQLRQSTETSLEVWQRILDDDIRYTISEDSARKQIIWLRGYLRALDDVVQHEKANKNLDNQGGKEDPHLRHDGQPSDKLNKHAS